MKRLTAGAETALTRAAEVSPTDANLTECIAFGLEEDDAPLIPVVNPLGGRPQWSTLEASRRHKKVKDDLMNSVAKAYSERKAAAEGRVVKGAMDDIMAEKLDKYQKANPDADLHKTENQPKKTSVYKRAQRHADDPMHHRLVVQGSRGPAPILAPLEPLLLSFIAEAAEVGIYMNTGDLRRRMADLMFQKPIGGAKAWRSRTTT